MIYLASPYSHPDLAVRQRRYEEVCRVASSIMETGQPVFCPIAHSHAIHVLRPLPETHDFWMSMDLPILRKCERVVVLMLDGWQESRGVEAEVEAATAVGIPVEFIPHEETKP